MPSRAISIARVIDIGVVLCLLMKADSPHAGNEIGADGAAAIADGLQHVMQLKSLDLYCKLCCCCVPFLLLILSCHMNAMLCDSNLRILRAQTTTLALRELPSSLRACSKSSN